jgi:tRNA dimethylallyltransferase
LAGSRVRVICGPTAAGKSAIAAALALEYGAAIISADSRQIYRGFDIGTA